MTRKIGSRGGLLVLFTVLTTAACTKQADGRCDLDKGCQDPRFWCDLGPPFPQEPGVCRLYQDGGVIVDASIPDAAPLDATPAMARLTISPLAVPFGSVVAGQQSSETVVTVSNAGDAASGTLAVTKSGADRGDFSITTNSCAAALAPTASCEIRLRFAPSAAGSKTASLDVTGSPGGAVAAALTGTALMPGALMAMTPSHDFGTVAIGSTGMVSLTFTNTGTTATGTLAAPVLADSTHYAIASNTCTGALAGSATCTIQIRFQPMLAGSRPGSVTLSATPGGNAALSFTGTGTGQIMVTKTGMGTVSSAPSGITCGAACSASFSVPTVNLTATPTAGSVFTGWTGGGCSGVGACPVTVDASTKMVSATFVRDAALTFMPATVDFGDTAIGSIRGVTIEVVNTGEQPSGVVSVTLGGADAAQYVLVSNCSAVLAPGARCSATLRFSPTSVGAKVATLAALGSPGGSANLAVSGTGRTWGNQRIIPMTSGYGHPSLSPDGLTLFVSNSDLFEMVRSSTGGAFAGPSPLISLNTAGNEFQPEISSSGLELFFLRGAALMVSTRSALGQPWPAATPIRPGDVGNVEDLAISGDGLTLYYVVGLGGTCANQGPCLASISRPSIGGAWGGPQSIPGFAAVQYAELDISSDERGILLRGRFFGVDPSGGQAWRADRSLGFPPVTTYAPVDAVAEYPSWNKTETEIYLGDGTGVSVVSLQ